MKKIRTKILLALSLLISSSSFVQAQVTVTPIVPCNQRLVKSIDFSYTGEGAVPERWSINDIDQREISIVSTPANAGSTFGVATPYNIPYQENGTFANVRTYNSEPLNEIRQYAIVENPYDLNPAQYAGIPNRMMVINTAQTGMLNNDDQYATFRIEGLKTGVDYYIEIKLWNVLNFDKANVTNSAGSWNPLLMAACKANRGNVFEGNTNPSSWTGTLLSAGMWGSTDSNHADWNMDYARCGRMVAPTVGGTYAILSGKKELRNNATGFDIVLDRRAEGNGYAIVLGVEYIKIYACEENANMVVSGSSFYICEDQDYELTAMGINPPGVDDIKWTYPDGTTETTTSRTIPITAPAGYGIVDTYTAEGLWAKVSINLTSIQCCFAYSKNALVFEESFNDADAPLSGGIYCAGVDGTPNNPQSWRDIPKLDEYAWTAYYYAANDHRSGAWNCWCIQDVIEPGRPFDPPFPGQYAVIKTASQSCFWGKANWQAEDVYDHTTGRPNGNSGFLAVNAAAKKAESLQDYFYKRQLTGLCANTTYEFSAWYASLAANDPAKVNIAFRILDDNDNILAEVTTGDVLDFKWHETKVAFTTPSTTTSAEKYYVGLYNNTEQGGLLNGNDLGIDDIRVYKCMPNVSLVTNHPDAANNGTELLVCTEDPVEIRINETLDELKFMINSDVNVPVYIQWYKNTNPNAPFVSGGTWELIEGADDLTYVAVPESTAGYYRVKISSDPDRAKDYEEPGSECGNNDVVTNYFGKIQKCTSHNIVLEKTSDIAAGKAICIGDEVVFTLKLTNEDATEAANNVQVTDVLPPQFELLSTNPPAVYNNNVWSAGTVEINANDKRLEIKTKAISEGTQVTNRAFVSNIGNVQYNNFASAPDKYRDESVIAGIKKQASLWLTVDKTEVNIGGKVLFTVTPDPNDRQFSYEWQKGILTGDNTYELLPVDNITVEVTAHDNICSDVVSNPVTVTVRWPNAIIWGGAVNGGFLFNTNFEFKLYVFNRYGVTIYNGNQGWDGTYEGKLVDPGVYYYVAEFTDGAVRKGTIEVVKEK